ncbi:MAG: YvrJ family protein [Clostridioides difficile]|nr:YvrJ family protein [Clostridioides difficile]
MYEDIQFLIANVGFPIALSMYLLIRIESKLVGLSDSIDKLARSILEMK